ncbi:MAG: hypothetical protein NTZ50_02565 [Chloroflexi bacterium]|nr:hypothetical protein [Chloroflexota bacterium]
MDHRRAVAYQPVYQPVYRPVYQPIFDAAILETTTSIPAPILAPWC